MNATWIIPFIILGGALQTCGATMNGQLYKFMVNPRLASTSLLRSSPFSSLCLSWPCLIRFPRSRAFALCHGGPPLAGSLEPSGSTQGLTLVNRVGVGLFLAIAVTAALITPLIGDPFDWFRMAQLPRNLWRVLGGLLLVAGVSLIANF